MKSRLNRVVCTIGVMLALATTLVFALMPSHAQAEGTSDHPDFTKTATVNSDGTVTIRLSITGKEATSATTNRANLILLYDVTASMRTFVPYEPHTHNSLIGKDYFSYISRYDFYVTRDDYPWKLRVNFDGNYKIDDFFLAEGNGERIQQSETIYTTPVGNTTRRITLAQNAATQLGATLLGANTRTTITLIPFKADVVYKDDTHPTIETFSSGQASSFNNTLEYYKQHAVDGTTGTAGTNWQSALQQAKTIIEQNANIPQSVALITDGEPNRGDTSIGSLASLVNSMRNLQNFKNLYYVYTADGASTAVTQLANATHGTLFSGTNSGAINSALNAIAQQVKVSTTYNTVRVSDGISSTVHFPIQQDGTSNPHFKYFKKTGSASETEWSNAPRATVTPTGSGNSQSGGSVQWDLSSVGDLDPNTTYSVEFTVEPNEDELDAAAAAAMNNAAAVTTSTNTQANMSYTKKTQIGTEAPTTSNGTYSIPTMPVIDVPYSTLTVTATFIGNRPIPDRVPITIKRDGQVYATGTLYKTRNFTDTVPVSVGHTYTVEETAPTGYSVTNPAPLVLSGVPKQSATLTIANAGIANKLRIVYTDVTDGGNTPLARGQFTVSSSDGGTVATLTTDATGKATSTNALEDGTYTLTQSFVPAGYQPLTDSYTLTVSGNTWTLRHGDESGTISEPEAGIKQIKLSTEKIIDHDIPSTGGSLLWMYIIGVAIAGVSIATIVGTKKFHK